WVDQRADNVATEIVARALELGQTFEDLGKRAGGFAGADHIDIQLGEMRGVRRKTVGKRFAALQDTHYIQDNRTEFGTGGEFRYDRQGAVYRNSCVQQSGKFLGEEQYVFAASIERRQPELETFGFFETDVDRYQAL